MRLEIPVGFEHDRAGACREVVTCDRERVAARVRREQEPRAVGEPDRCVVLGRVDVRRRVDDVAALDVDQEEVVVGAPLAGSLDDDPPPVGRDALDAAVAAELEDSLLPAHEIAHDDVEVGAVATVRRVGEESAAAPHVWRVVDEPCVDHERLELVTQQVQLRALVPALVQL